MCPEVGTGCGVRDGMRDPAIIAPPGNNRICPGKVPCESASPKSIPEAKLNLHLCRCKVFPKAGKRLQQHWGDLFTLETVSASLQLELNIKLTSCESILAQNTPRQLFKGRGLRLKMAQNKQGKH